ncbi:hypothetical protein H6G76_07970 [Nostoc sp. FACHB-152]|uniref:hypothetical protein n=1 Tax=unclassified Nostoc TaxID=2593658 RepID=UPI001684D7EC|nr:MULTISPECIES: hypothetical protein [unclassified Nostoc]MBD2447103.1 hypothetical protein [Nostoc sp. FACHB-152]MBD2469218.1 hypothetical protein [Nostoc sp. FACHB-145]
MNSATLMGQYGSVKRFFLLFASFSNETLRDSGLSRKLPWQKVLALTELYLRITQ